MLRRIAGIAGRAAVFFALYVATYLFLRGQGLAWFAPEPVLWLPTGVAVSGLWLLGWRYWPVVALGTLVYRLSAGYTFPYYVLGVIGSTLEALTACAVLRRLGFRRDFSRLQDGLALLAAAVVAPAVSASVGRTAYLVYRHQLSFFWGWMTWWRMNALGMLVVVPLALSWAGPPRPRIRLGGIATALAVAVMVLGLAWLLAGIGATPDDSGIVLSYLALPVAIYAAMRFGVRGAATAGAGMVMLALFGAADRVGPFVTTGTLTTPPQVRVLALQAVIAIIMTTPMLLGATIAEREAALKRAAEERGRREDLLASINRNVNEGLFRLRKGRLVQVNNAFARILGYDSPEELADHGYREMLADPEAAREIGSRAFVSGQLLNEELTLVRRDGSTVPVLVSCTASRAPDGTVDSWDGAVSDITGRKQLEEQLRTTQKMEALGKLAGGVAHDFNNLLTVIGGHAEMLRSSVRGEARDHAHEIAVATTRAARLTHQLLAYSRRQMLRLEVLDLREVIESMGSMLRRLIGEDVRLVTRHGALPASVMADRGQIEQVVLNLVVNARDAMPQGGTLTIETGRFGSCPPPGRVPADLPAGPLSYLSVHDTGHGMSPEVLSRAFDPFFTTKEPGKGTGLGLSTVDGIVRQSGGIAWIESAPAAGTTVRVCLPSAAPEPAEAPASSAPAAAPGSAHGTVLVAEDEPGVRDLVAHILGRAGYVVLVAADGTEALEILRSRAEIDLLLTDEVMPRIGGRALIEQVAEMRPGLRTVLMSGYADAEADADRGRAAGYQLGKPFTASALLGKVRAALEGNRPA